MLTSDSPAAATVNNNIETPTIDADILALVIDFLRERNLKNAQESLEKELEDKKLQPNHLFPAKILDQNKTNESEELDEILIAMRNGQFGRFTIHWEKLSQSHLDDPIFLALDFDIHLYFALYPQLFPEQGGYSYEGSKNSMDLFKSYLSERGKDLTKLNDESYLVFYALPFVPEPKKHPSFKHLFEDAWWEKVQTRFISFVKTKMDGLRKPAIYYLYGSSHSNNPHQPFKGKSDRSKSPISSSTLLKTLQTQLKDSEDRELDLSQRFSLLKSNFQRLLTITSDLVEQILGVMNGQEINSQFIADVCERLMAFKKHGEDESILLRPKYPLHQYTNQTNIKAIPERVEQTQQIVQQIPQEQPYYQQQVGSERPMTAIPVLGLNFKSIFAVFDRVQPDSSSDQEIIHFSRLLQAIRWRFMGTGGSSDDKTVNPASVRDLIEKDILGTAGTGQPWVMKWFNKMKVNPWAEWVVLEILLLTNAFASFPFGRSYVLTSTSVSWHWLIDECLKFWDLNGNSNGNASNSELIIPLHKISWTLLSKLSVRRKVQSYLLDSRFAIDFLHILQDPEPFIGTWDEDPWTAERTLAMCMNLSLRRKARKVWSRDASPDLILKILTDLMEHNHSHINTYANSAMFYLLNDAHFRDAATAMGIHDMLSYWLEQDRDDPIKYAQLELLQSTLEKDPEYSMDDADTISDDGIDPDAQNEAVFDVAGDVFVPELIEETIFERLVDLLDNVDGEGVKGEEFFIKYGYGSGSIPNIRSEKRPQPTTSSFSLPWSNPKEQYQYSSNDAISYSRPRTPFDSRQDN